MEEKKPLPTTASGLHGNTEEAILSKEIVKDVEALADKSSRSSKQKTKPAAKEEKAKLGNFFVRPFYLEEEHV